TPKQPGCLRRARTRRLLQRRAGGTVLFASHLLMFERVRVPAREPARVNPRRQPGRSIRPVRNCETGRWSSCAMRRLSMRPRPKIASRTAKVKTKVGARVGPSPEPAEPGGGESGASGPRGAWLWGSTGATGAFRPESGAITVVATWAKAEWVAAVTTVAAAAATRTGAGVATAATRASCAGSTDE